MERHSYYLGTLLDTFSRTVERLVMGQELSEGEGKSDSEQGWDLGNLLDNFSGIVGRQVVRQILSEGKG